MPVLLTGREARPTAVQTAIARNPMIIHFATHVTASPGEVTAGEGEFQSGFIALSLDSSGRMGFLGPREIVAQHVTAELVVLNGCHSGHAQALPSTGLMGLTRAWIGAGASAVISTMFPVEDGSAAIFMSDFYRNLRRSQSRSAAFALRETQLSAQRRGEPLQVWAAYSVLSRIL
jgi:CHAT domain-containing protein